ncbi:probable Xaa-Pro aminopeptidase [Fusarium fujikuroi]|uniref:Probable Xaa-Pro aminopeptidase n=1 Tax=Gibberella fujikuroi (strain CBS 195.34 / IMI 58289 / NRRL A-6831) TaxID=1279085 RepID=S0EMG7_GIBF5|nr:probable Xaa-Pro aminopeptidase [Fusarium fujikuroi IMI 58289]KLP06387.1 putative Xaa-Pro aminopeptidase [Fusarium fujikuroi]CCT75082.1 probable Xaa-Pro aminopeptidase [Fusarium fujikuroi IMI 58289]SCN91536.1 probable Xaa-Pro aminopeptidase [Fusarium fujikuroi]SCN97804.1 probable Xaa-Pro aminopeptidase [Fusarium fujikuroi]SCO03517.1 probable Xaa-Pro aminopeptidase [Fusarium fujikuroi]
MKEKEEPVKPSSLCALPKISRHIDPTKPRTDTLKPDGSEDNNDRVDIGPTPLAFSEWEKLGLELPHLPRMRAYRLQRIREQLIARDLGGILLFDPLNIRYATDTTNMQLWTAHNPARACFVAAGGYLVLWDFHGCEHLSSHLPLINEVRAGASFFYFETGPRTNEHAQNFGAQVDELLRNHAGDNRRLAVDRIEAAGLRALEAKGIEVCDGQAVTEHARMIKGPDEIRAMRCAIASCEAALAEVRQAIHAGVTENDVWAALHAGNIRRGGEWIETRLLSSGPRTNPWYQECGPRVLHDGDLVALDTDLVGVYGMCVDMSRTWICGDVEPTAEQKRLYRIALEHINANAEMVKPGVKFSELTQNGHRLPESCRAQRYGVMFHGVGLCDEYPCIRYPEDFNSYGYEGELQEGMVLCVEAYVGEVDGKDGVKLENQLLVTNTGYELLTHYPFEESFLRD